MDESNLSKLHLIDPDASDTWTKAMERNKNDMKERERELVVHSRDLVYAKTISIDCSVPVLKLFEGAGLRNIDIVGLLS